MSNFADREACRLGRRHVPVEMAIAKAEPPEPLIVAAKTEQNLLVPLGILAAQPFDSGGDRAATLDTTCGVPGASARRGVQPVHALDERRVRLGIRFDQQPAQVHRDAIRQRADRLGPRVRLAGSLRLA